MYNAVIEQIYYLFRGKATNNKSSGRPRSRRLRLRAALLFIMWIDSDILFTPQQFMRLLSHNADIVSGIYLMEGGKSLATVREWDEEFFKENQPLPAFARRGDAQE